MVQEGTDHNPRTPTLQFSGLKAQWIVNVNAKTKEGAIKIAAEKIAQAKAEAEGIAFGMYPKS